jgi:putative lipase involved disintegration of autophagic bodies
VSSILVEYLYLRYCIICFFSQLYSWIADLNTVITINPGLARCYGCLVHQGFYDANRNTYAQVLSLVTGLIAKYPKAQLMMAGHSLGGATGLKRFFL